MTNTLRKTTKTNKLPGLGAALLLLAAWRIYDRRARERIPSLEGLEDAQVSQAFDMISRLPHMALLRRAIAAEAAALCSQGEAIDLGCGPGYLVVEMAQRFPGLHVTGVDLSPALLSTAEAFARDAGVGERAAFRQGDARQIPFPDASLDLVVSTLSLHHWSEPAAVLDEVARVLKPGGAFYIFDLRRDMPLPFYLVFWIATQLVVPAPLLRINEPMGSRNAAYTPLELGKIARDSHLSGWQVSGGPFWVVLQGEKL